MATTIVTKSGSGAPTASDLVAGELAVDLTNKRLYTEDSGGTVLELGTNPSGDITFGDNGKAIFGAGSDLQIYHNGSTSVIEDSGTGNLQVRTSTLAVVNAAGTEVILQGVEDGAVSLYHNAGAKLATTATGIDVTGTATMDGLTVNGNASIDAYLSLKTTDDQANSWFVYTGVTDKLEFNYNGSGNAEVTIDPLGNVGIGLINPADYYAENLVVAAADEGGVTIECASTEKAYLMFAQGTSGQSAYRGFIGYDHNTTLEIMNVASSGVLNFLTGSSQTEAMRIAASGAVTVTADTTSDWALAVSNGTNSNAFGLYVNAPSTSGIPLRVDAAGSERMRINASGNLLVGTTAGSFGAKITAESTTSYTFESRRTGTGAEGHVVFRNGNGAVGTIFTNGTSTSYNTSSDQRLKENIADADDAGSKVDAIQVRKFDWIADGSHQDYGMVAQELIEVAPEAVSAPEDPEDMMGVDYSKLVPMMLKEIQSLRARVSELES